MSTTARRTFKCPEGRGPGRYFAANNISANVAPQNRHKTLRAILRTFGLMNLARKRDMAHSFISSCGILLRLAILGAIGRREHWTGMA
jgi:hypothetical protein